MFVVYSFEDEGAYNIHLGLEKSGDNAGEDNFYTVVNDINDINNHNVFRQYSAQ